MTWSETLTYFPVGSPISRGVITASAGIKAASGHQLTETFSCLANPVSQAVVATASTELKSSSQSTWGETLKYVVVGNPVSRSILNTTSSGLKAAYQHNWGETLKYISVDNPVSRTIVNTTASGLKAANQHDWGETLKYVTVDNPVSRTIVSTTASGLKAATQHDWGETLKYVTVDNPVSRTIVSTTASGLKAATQHNWAETLKYVTVDNPVSRKIVDTTSSGFKAATEHNCGETLKYVAVGNPISRAIISTPALVEASKQEVVPLPHPVPLNMWEVVGSDYVFIRVAGLSGATAVFIGLCGKYALVRIVDAKDLKNATDDFNTANQFHFLHSIALLVIPLTRRPVLTGLLMVAGTILYCASMYYRAFTGDKKYTQVATCGGICLIAAWITLIF